MVSPAESHDGNDFYYGPIGPKAPLRSRFSKQADRPFIRSLHSEDGKKARAGGSPLTRRKCVRPISRLEFFSAKGPPGETRTSKRKEPLLRPRASRPCQFQRDPTALFCLDPIEGARERFETLPANSSKASLLLNSATSAAKIYLLFAIKWVRSQPRFS
jgi:hypothetical protein